MNRTQIDEAMGATIQSVSRPRGVIPDPQKKQLRDLGDKVERTELAYRKLVVETLTLGASFSEVSKFTGLSTNTLQRWKREAGR